MGLVPFDPNETEPFYTQYYEYQDGDGLAVFRGKRHTDIQGDGIGSVLGGIFRAVAPTLKKVGKSAAMNLGKQALHVARDVLDGKNFKESAMSGLRSAGGDVLDDAIGGFGGNKSRKRKAPSGGKRHRGKRPRTVI